MTRAQLSSGVILASKTKLKICLASAELAPLAKTGGLADVTAALAAYLHEAGHDVCLLMPRYAQLESQGLQIMPVAGLQNLSMRIGRQDIEYAIDTTVLPGTTLAIYLLRCAPLFGRDSIYTEDDDEHVRFLLLSRAAIELCRQLRLFPSTCAPCTATTPCSRSAGRS